MYSSRRPRDDSARPQDMSREITFYVPLIELEMMAIYFYFQVFEIRNISRLIITILSRISIS
jgi:hypothetical protein